MKNIILRPERESDREAIRLMVKEAFENAEYSDGDEHNLVDRLRLSAEYIPELALVAECESEIVGFVMFTRISVGSTPALALAPLAVKQRWQHKGIGQALIAMGHQIARGMGESCSVVLGSPAYYCKSGYLPASDFGIRAPFDVPAEFYMVRPLCATGKLAEGIVCYSAAFGLPAE